MAQVSGYEQAAKAKTEEEQKRKEKKAAMARPTRANSSPNMDAAARAAQQEGAQQSAGSTALTSFLILPCFAGAAAAQSCKVPFHMATIYSQWQGIVAVCLLAPHTHVHSAACGASSAGVR